jgi:hypothetical protein
MRKRASGAVARRLVALGVVAVLAVALLGHSAPAATRAKAFPAGCWIGKSKYSGSYASGPVKAKVTNGKQTFVLWVGPGGSAAVGFLTVTGIGAGSLRIAGSELALEVKILGDFDLTGSAGDVHVNGTYSMTGTTWGRATSPGRSR